MRVGVLGPVVVDGDELPRRDRTVLCALAIDPGHHVTVDQLVDALWGDEAPSSAAKVVQGCVSRLRSLLGSEAIETDARGYRLMVPPDEIDHVRFTQLVTLGRDLAARGQAERAASSFSEALGLWRGRPLLDVAEWAPARAGAARLAELRSEAAERRVDALIGAGRHEDVLADARALVDAEPLRERRWALLARAQYLASQQGQALRTLRVARETLIEQLGIEPGAELTELEQSILHQELQAPRGVVDRDGDCPYRGLEPHDVGDAEDLFGRDQELAAALLRLRREGVLVVAGPSGSGKSSLVRAGVAASLERNGIDVAILTPESSSDERGDASRLPSGSALVVDQLEEVFTLPQPDQQEIFAVVVAHARRGPVVATLRSDRLDAVAAYPAVVQLLRRGVHLIGPMDDTELRDAIAGPAARAGLLLEPGLVDLLVEELAGEPGALPLLSYALRETWARREGRTLTVDAYRTTGGVKGAISQAAEAVYEGLSEPQRRSLRNMASRLVAPGGDGAPTRCRVGWTTIAPDADRQALVEQLVQARLLTSDGETVTLAHEAVARAWPRLRAWLEDDAAGSRLLHHLSVQSSTWDAMGRPASELYRGARLAATVEWREQFAPELVDVEADFIEASIGLADEERAATRQRIRAQARANRRLRVALALSACALCAAAIAGALALRQSDRADRNARAADAGRVGALALSVPDVDHSLLLAAEGVRINETPGTRGRLLTALGRVPALVGSAVLPGPAVAIATSSNEQWIATGGPLSGLSILDAESLQSVAAVDQSVASVAFGPDDRLLAVGTNRYSAAAGTRVRADPALILYDTDGFAPTDHQPVGVSGDAEVPDVAFSGDGRWLAAVTREMTGGSQLVAWDVDRLDTPVVTLSFEGEAHRVELSPSGSRAYVVVDDRSGASDRRTTRVISLPDGTEQARIATGGDGLDVSGDGRLLAISDSSDEFVTSARLFDTGSLDEVATVSTPGSTVAALVLSPDGARLAMVDRGNVATLWDIGELRLLEEFEGHSGSIWALGFTSDGGRLVSTGLDRRVLVWDLTGSSRVVSREVLPIAGPSQAVIPSPNARDVVSVSGPDLEFVRLGERALRATRIDSGHGQVRIVRWHPMEPHRLFTAGDDGTVREWDSRFAEPVAEHRVSTSPVRALAISPDGATLIHGAIDGGVGVLDTASGNTTAEFNLGAEVLTLTTDGDRAAIFLDPPRLVLADLGTAQVEQGPAIGFGPVRSAFSPNGTAIAVVGAGGETGLLDSRSGRWIHEPVTVHDDTVFSVTYAPDGRTFITGGLDGQLVLWNGTSGASIAALRPGQQSSALVPVVLNDGTTFVIGSTERSIYRWTTDTTSLVAQACAIARRELTPVEWSDAFGDRKQNPTCS